MSLLLQHGTQCPTLVFYCAGPHCKSNFLTKQQARGHCVVTATATHVQLQQGFVNHWQCNLCQHPRFTEDAHFLQHLQTSHNISCDQGSGRSALCQQDGGPRSRSFGGHHRGSGRPHSSAFHSRRSQDQHRSMLEQYQHDLGSQDRRPRSRGGHHRGSGRPRSSASNSHDELACYRHQSLATTSSRMSFHLTNTEHISRSDVSATTTDQISLASQDPASSEHCRGDSDPTSTLRTTSSCEEPMTSSLYQASSHLPNHSVNINTGKHHVPEHPTLNPVTSSDLEVKQEPCQVAEPCVTTTIKKELCEYEENVSENIAVKRELSDADDEQTPRKRALSAEEASKQYWRVRECLPITVCSDNSSDSSSSDSSSSDSSSVSSSSDSSSVSSSSDSSSVSSSSDSDSDSETTSEESSSTDDEKTKHAGKVMRKNKKNKTYSEDGEKAPSSKTLTQKVVTPGGTVTIVYADFNIKRKNS